MSKKYTIIRSKKPVPGGGYLESFEIGLADLGSLGDRYFDLAAYPYEDDAQALSADWLNLAGDLNTAIAKIRRESDILTSSDSVAMGKYEEATAKRTIAE